MEQVKKGFLSSDVNKIIVATLITIFFLSPSLIVSWVVFFQPDKDPRDITLCCVEKPFWESWFSNEDDAGTTEKSDTSDHSMWIESSPFASDITYETYEVLAKFALDQGWESYTDYNLNEYGSAPLYWVSDDGFLISNNGSMDTGEDSVDLGVYGCDQETPKYNESELEQISLDLGERIENKLVSLGLKKNVANSSSSYTSQEGPLDYTQSYEDATIKCSYTASSQCWSEGAYELANHFTLTCTMDFEKNYQEQKPFLEDLSLGSASSISVSVIKDDFALLGVSSNQYIGGYVIIAHKEDNKWKEIFSGQEAISCELMHEYKIPKEIQSGCWNYETDEGEENPY
jgi:hypothetical protein